MHKDRRSSPVIELDASLAEFAAMRATLTHPDAVERLSMIVESTELEGVFLEEFDAASI